MRPEPRLMATIFPHSSTK